MTVARELTAVQPNCAIAKAFSFLLILMMSFLVVSQANADDVLIFYNSDTSLAISRHDGALVTQNSKLLAKHIQSINPELNVRLEPITSLKDAGQILRSTNEKVRGIIFNGHGNQGIYALNSHERARGEEMADLVLQLPADKVSSRLTFYFAGCQMAKGDDNFQRQFSSALMRALPPEQRVGIDVIAHTSMSAFKSFSEPNSIHRASYHSGVGAWAERITEKTGYVLPNLLFFAGATGAASFAGLDPAALASVSGTALAAIFAKNYLEVGISKFGTQLTNRTEVKQSISNLLRVSFQADQCQAVFKLRSL